MVIEEEEEEEVSEVDPVSRLYLLLNFKLQQKITSGASRNRLTANRTAQSGEKGEWLDLVYFFHLEQIISPLL